MKKLSKQLAFDMIDVEPPVFTFWDNVNPKYSPLLFLTNLTYLHHEWNNPRIPQEATKQVPKDGIFVAHRF